MDVRIDVHGEGRGPHLLLVHGFLSSRGQWAPNLAALSKVCTPVTLELLGHGRSSAPEDPAAYTVAAYVARFEALRQSLGAARWFVCGQSFGAGLTMRYALEHPDRVIGQVFTKSVSGLSAAPAGAPHERHARAAALEAGGREALKDLAFYPRPSRRLAREIWHEMVDDADLISPAAIAETMRTTVPELSVAKDLGRITVPTLLVNGQREAAFQPLRDLAVREIPGLQVADVEGGHSINLDRAEAFNAAVIGFMARCLAAGRASG